MLIIPDELQWLEIAEDIAYQQALLAEKIGDKLEIMTMLVKQDWKLVNMAKKTMTNFISQL